MDWLSIAATVSLGIGFVCAIAIAADEFRHPQKMWIMNVVWPATALYFSLIALWAYFRIGQTTPRGAKPMSGPPEREARRGQRKPNWRQIALSSSHCGAGCTIGDVIAEFLVFGLGLTIAGTALWAEFAVDFAIAWSLGIAFQYFTIKPMRGLSAKEGVLAAIKADTLSISAFQVGMYGWMAVVYFVLFPAPHLLPDEARYWLMMQAAMVLGFFTTYPMNAWLLRRGIKETMG